MSELQWVTCPICDNKTRIKVREDTILEKFPLFCPKCKKETLISIKQLQITIHTSQFDVVFPDYDNVFDK